MFAESSDHIVIWYSIQYSFGILPVVALHTYISYTQRSTFVFERQTIDQRWILRNIPASQCGMWTFIILTFIHLVEINVIGSISTIAIFVIRKRQRHCCEIGPAILRAKEISIDFSSYLMLYCFNSMLF